VSPAETPAESLAKDANVNEVVVQEVVKAYYPSVLASADAARARAKDAYTIASAVAAGIVAAGVFGDFANQTRGTKVFAVTALLGWLAAAALFIYAVGGSTKPKSGGEKADADSFVRAAINNASAERRTVSKRVSRAQAMTVFAILVTVAAIGWAIFNTATPARKVGRIVLTPRGTTALAPMCGRSIHVLNGSFDPGSLGSAYLNVTLTGEGCGGAGVDLHLRKVDIADVAVP
jgi:hypothetical protein